MSDDSLVTLNNLKYYDQRLNDKLENGFVHQETYSTHSHDMKDIRSSKMYMPTTQPDQTRLSGYRKCYINDSAINTVQLRCRDYDMFYLTLTGPVTFQLINDRTDADVSANSLNTYARHIKVILKNPSAGTITWPGQDNEPGPNDPRVVWINGETPTYSDGTNKIDVVDLFTPDGITWFANIIKSWTLS